MPYSHTAPTPACCTLHALLLHIANTPLLHPACLTPTQHQHPPAAPCMPYLHEAPTPASCAVHALLPHSVNTRLLPPAGRHRNQPPHMACRRREGLLPRLLDCGAGHHALTSGEGPPTCLSPQSLPRQRYPAQARSNAQCPGLTRHMPSVVWLSAPVKQSSNMGKVESEPADVSCRCVPQPSVWRQHPSPHLSHHPIFRPSLPPALLLPQLFDMHAAFCCRRGTSQHRSMLAS
jgi:hypothetical protein